MISQERRGRWAAWLVGAVLAGVLAAGCGSSSHPDLQKPGPLAAKDDGQNGAILAAYRGSLADFNAVGSRPPVDPYDPKLSEFMSGNELAKVTATFRNLRQHDEYYVGTLTSLMATVTQFNGAQAVVVSCEHDAISVESSNDHKVVPGDGATKRDGLVNDLLSRASGTWKVTEDSDTMRGCK